MLSFVCPGMGSAYVGDTENAVGYFGCVAAAWLVGAFLVVTGSWPCALVLVFLDLLLRAGSIAAADLGVRRFNER